MAQDLKLIEILTGTAPDCRPKPGRTSPAFGWSVIAVKPSRREGGSQNCVAVAGLLLKIRQIDVKNVMSKIQNG
jgi:hypothetical protein